MMPDHVFGQNIKDIFRAGNFFKGQLRRSPDCPSDEDIAGFLSNDISGDKKEVILGHISQCPRCLDIAATSLKVLSENADEAIPDNIVRKLSSIPKNHARRNLLLSNLLKKNKYLIVSAVFFILSFIVDKYFMQFLLAAAIFGVKWVMDTGSTKALIMIYDAWKVRKEKDNDSDNLSVPHRQSGSGKPRARL
jgi:hypothetical protein